MENNELRAKFYQKRNAAIEEIQGIVNKGDNQVQNYKYPKDHQVLIAVRLALVKHKLGFSAEAAEMKQTHTIKTRSGEMVNYAVPLRLTLVDTETGYAETATWIGSAADSGDKALYKAYTSGIKYFLMKSLLIPTADDAEAFNADVNANDIPQPNEQESKVIDGIEKTVNTFLRRENAVKVYGVKQVDRTKLTQFFYNTKKAYPKTDAEKVANWLTHNPEFENLLKDVA